MPMTTSSAVRWNATRLRSSVSSRWAAWSAALARRRHRRSLWALGACARFQQSHDDPWPGETLTERMRVLLERRRHE